MFKNFLKKRIAIFSFSIGPARRDVGYNVTLWVMGAVIDVSFHRDAWSGRRTICLIVAAYCWTSWRFNHCFMWGK